MRETSLDASAKATVFVVGAGFSSEFGYPTARDLLPRLWARLDAKERGRLNSVVRFHHPSWDGRAATLPEIEEFLTELSANEDLLPELRSGGPFTVGELRSIRQDILFRIADWFHEIHSSAGSSGLRNKMVELIKAREVTVISFNWDYEIDRALFEQVSPASYGLGSASIDHVVVLKPHGSLNWYPASTGVKIKAERRLELWQGSDTEEAVYCFLPWRAPRSTRTRFVPWIVPPTHLKDFQHGMLRRIWRRCVDRLSVAREVWFLGYSLPPADWHARYILRSGFHNQIEGRPLAARRLKPTGKAKVYVVNPDPSAFRRIETIIGWRCLWVPERISRWLGRGTAAF